MRRLLRRDGRACARGQRAVPSAPRRPGRPVPATARRSGADRRRSRSARTDRPRVSRCAPPTHSVTSLAGHLDMHAAGPGALGWHGRRRSRAPRPRIASKLRVLTPRGGGDRVAVHRVAQPDHAAALALAPRAAAAAAGAPTLSAPMRRISVRRPGSFCGLSMVDEAQQLVRLGASGRPSCRSGCARRAGTRHARRPAGGCGRRSTGNAPSTRTSRRRWNRRGSAPARRAAAAPRGWCRNRSRGSAAWSLLVMPQADMKASVSSMRCGEVLVALDQRRAGDEAEVPAMHLVQVGIAAGGEGAQQVQRAGGLEIAGFHARGIGHAGGGGELRAVDDVAAIARQAFRRRRSRCRSCAAWRTARPCGRASPPARWRHRSARPPSAAAPGRCRG